MRRGLGFRRRRVRFERRWRFGVWEGGGWRMSVGRYAGRYWRGRGGALWGGDVVELERKESESVQVLVIRTALADRPEVGLRSF